MDDLERAFRDALKRADTVTVPVSIDPEGVRGARPVRSRWLGGLAIAASLAVVAGVGVGVWAALGRGLPAAPAAPLPTTVEVDLYSGRENPSVALDAALADEVYAVVDTLAPTGLEVSDLPDPGLGFRGFVVTPPYDLRPQLRAVPGAVIVDPAGQPEVLADPSGAVFAALLGGIPADLQQQVADQLVHVRIRNAGKVEVTDVQVTFPDNQVVEYGTVPPGGASRYAPVGLAYRYALILATADGTQRRWQPIDFMGETALDPGYYSYAISVDGDQIDLQFSQDPAPGDPAPTAAPGPTAAGQEPDDEQPDAGVPAAPGETATWVLLDPAVGPESTSLTVGVTRLACAGGVTGTVLPPVVEAGDGQVVITIGVEPLGPGGHDCQGNDVVEYVVELPEPLGDRDLVDGACLAGEAVGTAACSDGPVRRAR